ncbi:unnamed protein product, partial [Mesorhabditis belari]|uniref:Phytanoyl-CoA hydroxylase-interacting protein-like C-terminal domain-containing protein n=1 Tax=Mesorhabditis belari TaxID=2138241 RepID=A0AAF3EUL2_9BILA
MDRRGFWGEGPRPGPGPAFPPGPPNPWGLPPRDPRWDDLGRYPQQGESRGGPMMGGHSWRRGGPPPPPPVMMGRGRARPSPWAPMGPPPPYARGGYGVYGHGGPVSSWRFDREHRSGPDRFQEFRTHDAFRPFLDHQPNDWSVDSTHSSTPSSANAGLSQLDRDLMNRYTHCQPLFTDFSSHQKIDVRFEISARFIEISWTSPHLPVNMKYDYLLSVDGDRNIYNLEFPWHKTKHSVKTTPGAVYKFTLSCKAHDGRILAQTSKEVKAVFSMDELRRLHARAVDLNGNDMHSFRFLYRCKPQSYWNDIYTNCRGMMEPYAKDNNGQPSNAINGAISGLFFSARLFHGELPPSSPFGDRRLRVEAPFLLDTRKHTMYFADFYCNNALHYVTIVICVRDSMTDRFCAPRLIRLNPETNPFVKIQYYPPSRNLPEGGHEYFINKNVWVEVFYTESIDINVRQLDHIQATGMGTSRIGGLPNNKYCELCNLYPLRKPGSGEVNDENDDYFTELTPRESTIMLCNSLHQIKDSIGEDWAEVVGTVCHLVDQTCEQMENDFGVADAEQRSIERLNKTMEEMREQVELCSDIEVQAIADDIQQMVERFKEQRQQFLDLLAGMDATKRSLLPSTTSQPPYQQQQRSIALAHRKHRIPA